MFEKFPLRWQLQIREALWHVGEQARLAAMADPKLAAAGVGVAGEAAKKLAETMPDLPMVVSVPAKTVLCQAADQLYAKFGAESDIVRQLEEIIEGLQGGKYAPRQVVLGTINYTIKNIREADDALERLRRDILTAHERQSG